MSVGPPDPKRGPLQAERVVLASEPTEQHGDRTRVVAHLVSPAADDPKFRRAMGIGDHPRIHARDQIVGFTVQQQQRPRGHLRCGLHRADVAELCRPLVERRRELVVLDHPDHTPDTPSCCTCSTAAEMSSSHPPNEKSPSDCPQPRKLIVRTSHPISLAIRPASSGNDWPDAGASRPRIGNP